MNRKIVICLIFILAAIGIVIGIKSFDKSGAAYALKLDVYFFNENSSAIVAEEQNIKYSDDEDIIECVINTIIKGASNSKNVSIMDKNTKLNSITKQNQDLVVDFSEEFLSGDNTKNILAAYAVVKTLCQLPGVSSVKVTVESEELLDPDGNRLGFLSGEDINIEKDSDGPETRYVVLYFASPDTSKLVRETRTVKITDTQPIEQYVINELINGPENKSLQPVLSADTSVISAQTTDGTCFVNFTSNFINRNSGTAEKESIAIYAVVNSLTELDHVKNVQFLVNGQKISSLGTNSISGTFYRNESMIED